MKKISNPKKNEGFIKWNYDIFLASFKKIDFNIIWITILDTIFYLASGCLVLLWFQRISAKIQSFSLPSDIGLVTDQAAQRLADQVAGLNLAIRLSFILLLTAIIFLAAIVKGIIWAKTKKISLSFSLLSKFLALNLGWMGLWFLIIYIVIQMVQPQLVLIFLLFVLFLSSYMTYSLYSIFMEKKSIKGALNSLKLSFKNIHYFILPYVSIIALWWLSVFLSTLIGLDKLVFALVAKLYTAAGLDPGFFDAGSLEFVVLLVVSLLANPLLRLVTSFSRYYISGLVSEVEKSR